MSYENKAVITTQQSKITEVIVWVKTEVARAVVQAMAIASADNNQRVQNVGPN